MRSNSVQVVFICLALVLLGGCSGANTSRPSSEEAGGNSSTQKQGLDRCALVSDSDVQEVIGPHQPGTSDLSNMWGLQSCRWVATTAQKMDAYPNGWFDSIEVAAMAMPYSPPSVYAP